MLELKIENGDEENVVYIELLAAMSTWLHERIDTHNHFEDDMESYGDWLIETTKKWMSGYYEDLRKQYLDDVSTKFLSLYSHLQEWRLENNNRSFTHENFVILSYNKVRKENERNKKFRTTVLDGFFLFAMNWTSFFEEYSKDYLILDVYNKLGRGNEAIYLIFEDAKSIEEACFVANDIVDFIRKICEEEEFDLTPIGKN